MGLIDILNGMQNGPRGESKPGSGGMSPITMALLALLAYQAMKKLGGNAGAGQPGGNPLNDLLGGILGGGTPGRQGGGLGGGLGDLGGLLQGGTGGGAGGALGGLLGGLLGSGAAGSILNGGLDGLLKQFDGAGRGSAAQSWVGLGPNQQVSDDDIEAAVGSDTIDSLAVQAGLSRIDLMSGLREQLPQLVDRLTPDGRLPTDEEMSRLI